MIARQLEMIAAQLRTARRRPRLVDRFRDAEILSLGQAASIIGNTSAESVRRLCVQTAKTERPLGVKLGPIWLVDLAELLDMIERQRGKHDRLAAETRSREIAKLWGAPHQSPEIVSDVERAKW